MAEANGGRLSNGRFGNGNKYGNGRHKIDQDAVALFHKVLSSKMTPKVMAEVIDKVISKALKGDAAYTRLLFEYMVGKPEQAVNLRSVGELEITVKYDKTIGVEVTTSDD